MKLSSHGSDIARQFIVRELARTKAVKGDLATAMGFNASTLSKLLAGGRRVEYDELHRAFAFFGTSPDAIQAVLYDIYPGLEKFTVEPLGKATSSGSDVTVDELAKTLIDGEIEAAKRALTLIDVLRTGVSPGEKTFRIWPEVIEAKPRPKGFLGPRRLQAIYMAGDAGSPRYLDGEIVVFDLDRQPAIGDYVIAETVADPEDGYPSYVGRLAQRTESGITLQAPDGEEKSLEFSDIIALRRIISMGDFLG